MKSVQVEDFQAHLDRFLHEVQDETIVITRNGKPCAVVHGVEGDLETAELAHSKEFWAMIEQRRNEPTIPWDDAKSQLE